MALDFSKINDDLLLLGDLNLRFSACEMYELARYYPWRQIDDGYSRWQFLPAWMEGMRPCSATEMILAERRPTETEYHWEYARDIVTGERWCYDRNNLIEIEPAEL